MAPPSARRHGSVAMLHSMLGGHGGLGKKSGGLWSREAGVGVRFRDVRAHLAGEYVVAPLHPRGPWRYVVLDLDRHNALQEKFFEQTVAWVQEHFPGGIHVVSSSSEGLHVYVPVPTGRRYGDAARLLRGYVAAHGAGLVRLKLRRQHLCAEVIEVPLQPPRLPFGAGSHLVGHEGAPIDEQIEIFTARLAAGGSDFERAVRSLARSHRVSAVLTRATRRRLDAVYLDQFVSTSTVAELPSDDPWRRVLKSLPKPLRVVATRGTPALGSRTTWTTRLITCLTMLVDESEARVLMKAWVLDREHMSEDIHADIAGVLTATDALVVEAYAGLGVPVRVWSQVRVAIQLDLGELHRGRSLFREEVVENPPSLEEALATAFFILRKFGTKSHSTRSISADEFGQFVGRNRAHVMQSFLEHSRRWLVFKKSATPGVSSRVFGLAAHLWPFFGDEPMLAVPDFELPRRRWV